jgi:hypothetical protein
VVLVDVQIALGSNLQVDRAMLGQQLKHVIEKTDPGLDVGLAGAIQIQRETDLGFGRLSVDLGSSSHRDTRGR